MMRVTRMVRRLAVGVGIAVVLVLGYGLLLARPEVLFTRRHVRGDFIVYSRAPLGPAVDSSLDSATRRLAASALHGIAPRPSQRVFVAESRALYTVLTGPGRRAMAKNYELGNSIFLPTIDAAGAQVVHFDGRRAPLASIVAHEAAHSDLQRAAGGVLALWRLPFWKKEGYPELVAHGDTLGVADLRVLLGNPGRSVERRLGFVVPRSYFEAEAVWRYLVDTRGLSIAEILASDLDPRDVLHRIAGP